MFTEEGREKIEAWNESVMMMSVALPYNNSERALRAQHKKWKRRRKLPLIGWVGRLDLSRTGRGRGGGGSKIRYPGVKKSNGGVMLLLLLLQLKTIINTTVAGIAHWSN